MKFPIQVLTILSVFVFASCSSEPQTDLAKAPAATPEVTTEVSASSEPLPQMVNLGADKCIPCKQMIPVRNAIAEEYSGQIQVSFIDVWADRSAGAKFGIRIIPTQIILDADGVERFRHEGYWPKEEVVETLKRLKLLAPPSSPNRPDRA